AAQEAAPPSEFGVVGHGGEGAAGTVDAAGKVVGGQRGAGGDAADPADVDAVAQQHFDAGGGVGVAHAAAFEDEGDVGGVDTAVGGGVVCPVCHGAPLYRAGGGRVPCRAGLRHDGGMNASSLDDARPSTPAADSSRAPWESAEDHVADLMDFVVA